MKTKHIKHLYWRMGFGITPIQLKALSKMSNKKVIDNLIESSKKVTPLKIDTPELDVLMEGAYKKMKANIKKIQIISRQKSKVFNADWIERLANPHELLREKMTLFWANHFVCKDNNFIFTQQFNNTLRVHALGNFKDFVLAVSKEAAMTKYLNTNKNRKEKPNENFARELMELFTLGVGHYTEEDIKESARAFTGFGHNLKGEFVFRERVHDDGSKTFFGKTGNFKGEDIIDLILQKKQCAKHICEKIYRYFVNDVIDQGHVNEMADVFYSDYNIENLIRFMLTSTWFYEDKNIGNKIKSPIELLVGMKTLVPFELKDSRQLLYLQKVLGQTLLDPPNVAGWKGGRNWIDSNTIVLRLKLPSLLLNNAYISKIKKEKSNESENKKAVSGKKIKKYFKTEANWDFFNEQFKDIDVNYLDTYVLQCEISKQANQYLKSLKKVSKQEYCIQLMSLPEYQMC